MDAEIGKQERLLEIIPGRLIDSTPATDADRRREGRSGPSEPIAKALAVPIVSLGSVSGMAAPEVRSRKSVYGTMVAVALKGFTFIWNAPVLVTGNPAIAEESEA